MNYMVVWMPDALSDLAAIWIGAPDRNAVTRASQQIDRALSASPHSTGILAFDTVRELVCAPLGIEFEVIDADRRVFVLTVWDTSVGQPDPTGN